MAYWLGVYILRNNLGLNHNCTKKLLKENEETLQEGQASLKNILEEGRHKTLIKKENQNNFWPQILPMLLKLFLFVEVPMFNPNVPHIDTGNMIPKDPPTTWKN